MFFDSVPNDMFMAFVSILRERATAAHSLAFSTLSPRFLCSEIVASASDSVVSIDDLIPAAPT
jgi:hypothetical protein